MEAPGRRETWVTWPSTQTGPSREIHWPMSWATFRTGQGSSGELRSAIPAA